MTDYDTIVRDRQKAIRRQIDSRDMSIKAIHLDGGWKEASTVLSYFPADTDKVPATMSVAALYRFLKTKALPADLLSMLLPAEFAIVRVPEGINLDELADDFADFLAAKNACHHPESEAGREIGENERKLLTGKALKLVSVAA